MKELITQRELKERLRYDPETGVFTWIKTPPCNAHLLGATAGSKHSDGYWHINIDGRLYLAHRLAWLYVNGRHPDKFIDHKNGVRNDNRISNIREATRAENSRNRKLNKNNPCGAKGVAKHNGRWRARIRNGGKLEILGSFATIEQAKQAYQSRANVIFGAFQREAAS